MSLNNIIPNFQLLGHLQMYHFQMYH